MAHISAMMTRLYLGLQERLEKEEGLSAMEYLVMMLGLVLAVFAAYKFAGSQIRSGVENFFNTVFGS